MAAHDEHKAALDEAARWHARLQSRAVAVEDITTFYAWRRVPANAAAYAEVERTWAQSASLADDPDILAALRATRKRTAWRIYLLSWRRRIAARPVAAGVAVLLPLLLGAGIAAWISTGPRYRTASGEQLAVNLDDGSRVRLNTRTQLRVAYSADERRIILAQGEAFFDVAHDTSRPFWVVADGVRVRAVGTAFDVRRDGARVRVSLVRGAIIVWHPSSTGPVEEHMTAGQVFDSVRPDAPISGNAARETSWLEGRLIFQDTPLSTAIAEMNRYGGVPIELDDDALAAERISGNFATGDSQGFVQAVAAILDVKATSRPDRIELGSR